MANNLTLPVLPLKHTVAFPYLIFNFELDNLKAVETINEARDRGDRVLLLTLKTTTDEEEEKDFYKVGVVADIKYVINLPNGNARVFLSSEYRATVQKIDIREDNILAHCKRVPIKRIKKSVENETLLRAGIHVFKGFCEKYKRVPQDALVAALNATSISDLADIIGATALQNIYDQQVILSTLDPHARLEKAITLLHRELDMLGLETDLINKLHDKVSKENKEHFLREQMDVIKKELGDEDTTIEEYYKKLDSLTLSEDVYKKLKKEINRLDGMSPNSPEKEWIASYLDVALNLPWNEQTDDNKNSIVKAEKILEKSHYGLEDVKKRILEFLAVRKLTGKPNGQIICLVGAPGVGKTSIAKSIAESLGRSFVRVSLGGVRDEAEIKGHRRTYVASMPGRIIKAISEAKTNNPVILLDEIDKMQADLKGDPTAALLEVLDSEQNYAFRDSYLEVPFDLSNVLFITTANSLDNVPRPFLDRLEVIRLDSYTSDEKEEIAIKYLVPKQLEKHGIKKNELIIKRDAIKEIIDYYTREAGVRNLEREIAKICRKFDLQKVKQRDYGITVTEHNLHEFLGKRKFNFDLVKKQEEIGVAIGLAWTEVGGETLEIETNVLKGSGKLEITGQLGDVMKESAKVAVNYVRSRLPKMGIEGDYSKDYDIHIHVPEGATPKDGPSAGIAIATSFLSAASNIPVRSALAMTGEVTIRGRVLPIGGLKEKAIAAHRMGIKTVLIPNDNVKDLDKVPEVVKDFIKFIPVSTMDEVVASSFNIPGMLLNKPDFPSLPNQDWSGFYEHK